MKIFEIGTGYTSIPAQLGAATEIVVEELTRSMLKLEQNVTIIDIKDKNRVASDLPIQEVFMPQFFSSTDTKLGIIHKLKRILYSISLSFKLKKIIRNKKEKIVLHFHNQYNLYFFLKLLSSKIRQNVEIVYTIHSYIWQGEWESIRQTVQKRYFQEVYCVCHADRVFVLNEQTKEHLIHRLKICPNRIFLIPNGVNTSTYSLKSHKERLQLKNKFDLSDKTIFFQVGSVCERKNQLTALQLLLPFLKESSSFVYIYAGGIISPEYKQQIDKLASENQVEKQVIYAGELSPGVELNNYYNMASACIFPSVMESFGLVILEALSVGIPVLVDTNADFELKSLGGCLRYDNPEHFRTVVNEMILNEENRQQQIAKGLKVIKEQYSWDVVAQLYLNKFNS
jgi:glycosyltransferase involved in cell wall biosynthesis